MASRHPGLRTVAVHSKSTERGSKLIGGSAIGDSNRDRARARARDLDLRVGTRAGEQRGRETGGQLHRGRRLPSRRDGSIPDWCTQGPGFSMIMICWVVAIVAALHCVGSPAVEGRA